MKLQQEQHSLICVAKQQHNIYMQCCLGRLSRNVAVGNGDVAIGASNITLVHNN